MGETGKLAVGGIILVFQDDGKLFLSVFRQAVDRGGLITLPADFQGNLEDVLVGQNRTLAEALGRFDLGLDVFEYPDRKLPGVGEQRLYQGVVDKTFRPNIP